MTPLLELVRAMFAIVRGLTLYVVMHPLVALGVFAIGATIILITIDTDRRHD